MAAETITVYIDPAQLAAQKRNNYNLYLAKMVNGQFTVIWQSMGPIATVDNPDVYEYQNTFSIAVPSYQVNYGTVSTTSGSVTFAASGLAQNIDIGQTVALSSLGRFGSPTNDGTPGQITITNQLAGNPNAILLDNQGNAIFVNTQSGMDIGITTLTPIDAYQIWFDNYQDTGTIIAHNVNNVATVTFSGGTTDRVISYNAAGEWQDGGLSQTLDLAAVADLAEAGGPLSVTVLVTFKYALTLEALTYLLSKLINKFPLGLSPTRIQVSVGTKMQVQFEGARNREILTAFGLDKYEAAVNQALTAAKADRASDLQRQTWLLSEPIVAVSY